MFPSNQWVFVALATDTTSNKQNGFRYIISSTTATWEFKTRSSVGNFYPLKQTGKITLGGGNGNGNCACSLRYARIYIDYYPNSVDEMINLAIMEQGIILNFRGVVRQCKLCCKEISISFTFGRILQ